jgi:hypothetical protein
MYINGLKSIITNKKNTGLFVSDTDFVREIILLARWTNSIISLRKSVSETTEKSYILYLFIGNDLNLSVINLLVAVLLSELKLS